MLQQDKIDADAKREDIKEVFFPGNHGDVGGGWLAQGNKVVDEANDPLQLSDLALEWMISELDALPLQHPTDQIRWNEHKHIFLRNFRDKYGTSEGAATAPMHDILSYGGGVSWAKTLLWRIMGRLTLIKSKRAMFLS